MSRLERDKNLEFEAAGIMFIASSKRSLKLEIRDKTRVFMDAYYVSIKDVQDVLNGRQKTAQLVKLVNQVCDSV